jgi:hypothetical protein
MAKFATRTDETLSLPLGRLLERQEQ